MVLVNRVSFKLFYLVPNLENKDTNKKKIKLIPIPVEVYFYFIVFLTLLLKFVEALRFRYASLRSSILFRSFCRFVSLLNIPANYFQ